MTKQSQKQRRENKKDKINETIQPVQTIVIKHDERLISKINEVYPSVDIIDMTEDVFTNKKISVKKLDALAKDENKFIVVFNCGSKVLHSFLVSYLELKNVPTRVYLKITDEVAFLLVRSSSIQVFSADDDITTCLKTIFKPSIKECLICFYEFIHEEKRVSCCNCRAPLCTKCFEKYITENPGWCVQCRQHMIFPEWRQPDQPDNEENAIINAFVAEQMKTFHLTYKTWK
jgi:hypothetical protein